LRCGWCGQFWQVPLDDYLLCYLTDDNINTTMKECVRDLMLAEGGKYGTPVDHDEHMCQNCTNAMDDEWIAFELLYGREPDADEMQDHEAVVRECIQVAAMAIRIATEGDCSFHQYDEVSFEP
jgi:hypothetical protein